MYLYSDDLYQIKFWQKNLSTFNPIFIDNIEKLFNIEKSLIVCSVQSLENIDLTLRKIILKENKVLLLDNTPNFFQGQRFLKVGIHGYGNVMMSKPFLESAIMTLQDGLVWLHPELMQNLIINLNDKTLDDEVLVENLTSREKEVCLLLKDGLSNNAIANTLQMSINTVKAHIKKIYEKLNVNDRLSLALLFKK